MISCQGLNIAFDYNGQTQVITPVAIWDEHEVILVDCGYPDFKELLEQALGKHELKLDLLTRIIVTHHDMDHIGSLAAIKREYPHIEIIAHEVEAPYIEGDKKFLRIEQAEASFDELPEAAKPQVEQFIHFLQSIEPAAVNRKVVGGERLPWCGGIEVVDTPGHTPGHMSLYLPAIKTIIAGDVLVVENGKLQLANPEYASNLEEAVRSAEKLLQYDIEQLICYHGGLFAGDVQQGLKELLQQYS